MKRDNSHNQAIRETGKRAGFSTRHFAKAREPLHSNLILKANR